MTPSSTSAGSATWTAPQCPFKIDYSLRALDDIRLAVTDAFFSLPRGGAEIGGILLGSWESNRLTVSDFVALNCEHAFGPSFSLSRNDESRLEQLLAAKYGGARVVGWYHSHTRSEIFLSQADLEIHNRFFPEPWQVAMVLRPHTFHPTRIGFFFRNADGHIHSEASYREDTLTPLPMKPVLAPKADAEPASGAVVDAPPRNGQAARSNPLLDAAAALAAARQGDVESHAEPIDEDPSQETDNTPYDFAPRLTLLDKPSGEHHARAGRWPLVLACGALVAVGFAAFATREAWLPKVNSILGRDEHRPAPLGLNLLDREGQLQIRWNPQSAAIPNAVGGVLRISGSGPFPQEITLDKAHLLNGYLTIQRQSDHVDVALVVPQPGGAPPAAEITTYIGKMPDKKPIFVEDPDAKKEREHLSQQVGDMQTELKNEIQRNQQLQHSVDQLKNQLRLQTQQRLANQDKQ